MYILPFYGPEQGLNHSICIQQCIYDKVLLPVLHWQTIGQYTIYMTFDHHLQGIYNAYSGAFMETSVLLKREVKCWFSQYGRPNLNTATLDI